MYGTMIRITARSTARLNCSAMVGDMLANSTSVMSPATMSSPACGTPCLFSVPKTLGNMPSSAAALADWPTGSIQPPSEPTDFSTAQTLMTMAAGAPMAMRATSANGACDSASCAAGMMPMITVELSMYTTAASTRPMMVASGMLRDGFSITPADTAALSTPMYAHNTIEPAREMALKSESPLTFQLALNISG